jgi:hypothetical protein
MNDELAQNRPDFLERHYTLKELAKAWHTSVSILKPWFENEPGVIKWGAAKLTKTRKRTYLSLRIPESVARRVYRRHTGKDIGR